MKDRLIDGMGKEHTTFTFKLVLKSDLSSVFNFVSNVQLYMYYGDEYWSKFLTLVWLGQFFVARVSSGKPSLV